MEGDARPREAVHVRHPGVVIQVGVMIGVLLEDAENARWRLAPALAARYGPTHDPAGGVVDNDLLAA